MISSVTQTEKQRINDSDWKEMLPYIILSKKNPAKTNDNLVYQMMHLE